MDITPNINYVYITIPKDYICTYHKILAMLADYGEDMLKDCKASCTDKNSGVIECFNMFNAAVAALKLGKTKLAETIKKYVDAKILQIYKGVDNSTSFVFPVDENGELKAFVSCGETVQFEMSAEDGELFVHKYGDGVSQHFTLSPEDYGSTPLEDSKLVIDFTPSYEKDSDDTYHACADIEVYYDNQKIDSTEYRVDCYFDDVYVASFPRVKNVSEGEHEFKILVRYGNIFDVKVKTKTL